MTETQPPPLLDHLTALERQVIHSARCGDVVKPAVELPLEELKDTDNPGLLLRAELIRELLMGRRGELDPRGLRVRRVRVVGHLDLDHVTAVTGLTLAECAVSDKVTCHHARLHELNLYGSRLSDLHAEALHTDGAVTLNGVTVTGAGTVGAVRLVHAHIGGQLDLQNAHITNDTGPALLADYLRTEGRMSLGAAIVTGSGEIGAVRLVRAHIGGQLDLQNAHITNDTGPALLADNLRTDGETLLRKANMTGTDERGAARLFGAHIGGRLNLQRTRITNDTGPALHAEALHTDSTMALKDATIIGAGENGAVRLVRAHIGGQLDLQNAHITNDTGPALLADNLRTDGETLLRKANMTGTDKRGAVCLFGAHIGGQLEFDQAQITNAAGVALYADDLRTDNSMFLRHATITGTGDAGAVQLVSAHIGRYLDCDYTQITNIAGPALYAVDVRIDKSMYLRHATITGTGKRSAVALARAHIGGSLVHDQIRVTNESGPLMNLSETQVTGVLSLSPSIVCLHARTETGHRRCPDNERTIAVDGFVFRAQDQERVSWQQWLHLLIHHTRAYRPQPYQQLAAVERAAGHDNNARRVLIAQQEDLRHRTPEALGGWLGRERHRLWGWLGRYGYRSHRLVVALAFVLALAAGLGYIAGQVSTRSGHHAAERVTPITASTNSPGMPCSTAELIGLGIDRGLPLGATGLRARCDLDTGTRWGQAFTYAIWVLQALVWALATLAVAAYTGLVRKPT